MHDKQLRRPALGFGVLVLAALTACGGGGGYGTEVQPGPQGPSAPSLTQISSVPAAGGQVSPDGGVLKYSFQLKDTDSASAAGNLTCDGGAQPSGQLTTTTLRPDKSRLDVQHEFEGLPANTSCLLKLHTELFKAPQGTINDWELRFTTSASTPLTYSKVVVGLLGDQPVMISKQAPYVRPATLLVPLLKDLQGVAGCEIGSTPYASGRWPLLCTWGGASSSNVSEWRLNPAQGSITAGGNETLPPGHEYTTNSPSPNVHLQTISSAWHSAQLCSPFQDFPGSLCVDWLGGLSSPPIAGARAWASDGDGGWFYVLATSTDTLRWRSATGTDQTLYVATVSADTPRRNAFTLLMSLSR